MDEGKATLKGFAGGTGPDHHGLSRVGFNDEGDLLSDLHIAVAVADAASAATAVDEFAFDACRNEGGVLVEKDGDPAGGRMAKFRAR